MEGNNPASSEKQTLQDETGGQITDSGEGDMCSSEYSLISSSTLFNAEEQAANAAHLTQAVSNEEAAADKDKPTSQSVEQSQTEAIALTKSEVHVKTELLAEDFDMPSIQVEADSKQSSTIYESENKEAVDPTITSKVESKESNREIGDESFELISKGDVDEMGSESPEKKSSQTDTETSDVAEKADNNSWMYVLGHEKLKKKVTRAGQGQFTRPVYSQVVSVRCCGRLSDGTVVEDWDRLTFTIGDADVVQALDLCLPIMELEEISIIETDPKYAYGDTGREPDIPPGAHLTYEIEVLNIEDQPDYPSLPMKERIDFGSKKRERGNWWYARTDYNSAINSYNKALTILDENRRKTDSAEDIKSLIEERVKCQNNLGAAQLKVEAWQAAIKSCDAVLKHQPENVKALFRKGKCLAGKGETEAAIAILRESLKIEPESKLIHNELSRLLNKHKIQSQTTKEMYQRMLGTDQAKATEESEEQGSMWRWYAGGAALAALASAGFAAYKYM